MVYEAGLTSAASCDACRGACACAGARPVRRAFPTGTTTAKLRAMGARIAGGFNRSVGAVHDKTKARYAGAVGTGRRVNSHTRGKNPTGELKCRSRKDKMKPEQHPIRRIGQHKTVARCNLQVQCSGSPRTSATPRALFLELTLVKGAKKFDFAPAMRKAQRHPTRGCDGLSQGRPAFPQAHPV